MTSLEIRIDGAKKRIEKINTKITRLENLIAKKQSKIASGKEENNKYPSGEYYLDGECKWHRDDIERAKRDLRGEQFKLKEYMEKRNTEIERDSQIPNIPVVEEFLKQWKEKADTYYRKEVKELREWKAEYRIYFNKKREELRAEFGYKVNTTDKEVEKREIEYKIDYKYERTYISNKWTQDIVNLDYYEEKEFDNKLEKMLNDEVNRKRIDLYTRCSAKVGVITDATELKIGVNASLNGFVTGENGRAEVETIYAGGYNIQCLHYRVLVK